MWERLRRKRHQPDYCGLVEGTVTLARSSPDSQTLLTGLADHLARTLGSPRLVILLKQDDWISAAEHSSAGLTAAAGERLSAIEIELARRLAHETAPVEVALAELESPLGASFENLFENLPAVVKGGRIIFAPFVEATRTLGAVLFYRVKHQRQTDAERHALRALATVIGFALHHQQSLERAREAAQREERTHHLLAAIRNAASVEDVLKAAVNGLGTTLAMSRVAIFIGEGDIASPGLKATSQPLVASAEYLQSALVPSLMGSALDLSGKAIHDNLVAGDLIVLPDAGDCEANDRLPFVRLGVRALVFAPITHKGQMVAVLALEQFDQPRDFTDEALRLIRLVAVQMSAAMDSVALYKEVRESATRAALVNQIIHGINQSNYLDEIFPLVAGQLGKHLAVDRVTITRRQEDIQTWINECEYSEGKVTRTRRTYRDADTGDFKGLLDGDVMRCDDTENDPRLTPAASALLAKVGTRSFASLHIAFNGESHLTISAIMRTGPRHWTEEEIELLRAVANQVRIALQRAELFNLVSQGKFEWEATFDALTDGVFIFDENGTLRRVNQTAAALEGTTVSELIGSRCCDLLQGSEGEVCRVSQVLETKRPHTYELIPERLKRPVLVTIAPLGTSFQSQIDGEEGAAPRGAVCIVRELSELRAAEAVAREQRNFLVKLIEHANDSIFALSPSGRLIWFNEQLIRQSGFSRDTLKSITYLDCVPESEKPLIAERFRRAVAGAAQSFEIRTFRRNSESRLMLMTLTPIYDEGGVTSVLAIARDITEERVASERAAQADKLRALGQLASGVAHNFNNILAAILGHAQLLKREWSDEHLIARLDIIEKAALDGAQTVKRIQGFGLQPSDEVYETFDVNHLLQDSTTLTRARWQHEAQARGLTYDVALDLHSIPMVRGTASELREVFVNIILNALDAMPQGGRLRISSKHKNGFVRVSFSDNGVGMTRDVRQRIFEPFFTTKGVTGMGLGLAVSYSIIERHGGEVDVRSIPGRGTTFTISLPSSRAVYGVASITDSIMAKTARVLVVDDDDRVRDVLVGMLKLAGHAADFAANGREALGRLEREAFDLVFTDLSMPDVDGWALAEEIRRRWPQLKIVMVTGYAVQAEGDHRRYRLVNDIISKPIRFDDINATLSHVLA
ncbi:MAG: GAF domain-containing protein [Blastocatellia bacterium]